jgi:hypothetical protein
MSSVISRCQLHFYYPLPIKLRLSQFSTINFTCIRQTLTNRVHQCVISCKISCKTLYGPLRDRWSSVEDSFLNKKTKQKNKLRLKRLIKMPLKWSEWVQVIHLGECHGIQSIHSCEQWNQPQEQVVCNCFCRAGEHSTLSQYCTTLFSMYVCMHMTSWPNNWFM